MCSGRTGADLKPHQRVHPFPDTSIDVSRKFYPSAALSLRKIFLSSIGLVGPRAGLDTMTNIEMLDASVKLHLVFHSATLLTMRDFSVSDTHSWWMSSQVSFPPRCRVINGNLPYNQLIVSYIHWEGNVFKMPIAYCNGDAYVLLSGWSRRLWEAHCTDAWLPRQQHRTYGHFKRNIISFTSLLLILAAHRLKTFTELPVRIAIQTTKVSSYAYKRWNLHIINCNSLYERNSLIWNCWLSGSAAL
jgi:hypothetical protein